VLVEDRVGEEVPQVLGGRLALAGMILARAEWRNLAETAGKVLLVRVAKRTVVLVVTNLSPWEEMVAREA